MAVRELAIGYRLAVRHERRAFAHGVIQHGANRTMQSRNLFWRERIRSPLRVQSGAPQGLVRVDVAHSTHHGLVHDGRLQWDAASLKLCREISGGELAG